MKLVPDCARPSARSIYEPQLDRLGKNTRSEFANVAIEEITNPHTVNQISAELPINPEMYVEPTEESKDDVLAPTIITIDESGTIRKMDSRIKNLAIKDNYDSNDNNLESKTPSTIASVNSRTFLLAMITIH